MIFAYIIVAVIVAVYAVGTLMNWHVDRNGWRDDEEAHKKQSEREAK
jgi:nitrate reductase gamma subunit